MINYSLIQFIIGFLKGYGKQVVSYNNENSETTCRFELSEPLSTDLVFILRKELAKFASAVEQCMAAVRIVQRNNCLIIQVQLIDR